MIDENKNENNKENKKSKVLNDKKSGLKLEYIIPAIILIVGGLFFIINNKAGQNGITKTLKAKEGIVSIPVSNLKNGKAKYYNYTFPEKTVMIFAVKSSDGQYRAAFNACDVCYPAKRGYHQEDDFMVCNNCGLKFPTSRINIDQGGCNPAGLISSLKEKNLLINVTDIHDGLKFF